MKHYRYQYENDEAMSHKMSIYSSDHKKIVSGLDLEQATKICSILNSTAIRLEEAKIAETRYEIVRKLSPGEFKDIYAYNLFSGNNFDKIVDAYGEREPI